MWRNKLMIIKNTLSSLDLVRLIQLFNENYNENLTEDLLRTSLKWPMSKKEEYVGFLWRHSMSITPEEYATMNQLYLNDNQIIEMVQRGHSIGCHTMTHPLCNKLTVENIKTEIIDSADRIEARYNTPVRWMSYPFGECLSHADEQWIRNNSSLERFLGIRESLSNFPDSIHWERVGMETSLWQSVRNFYFPFVANKLNRNSRL